MGNGVAVVTSERVNALYQKICQHKPQYRHYTIRNRYMVGVVGEPLSILIYDFERSIKPLMRITDGGKTILLRDFWKLQDGITVLEHLEAIAYKQRVKVDPPKPVKRGIAIWGRRQTYQAGEPVLGDATLQLLKSVISTGEDQPTVNVASRHVASSELLNNHTARITLGETGKVILTQGIVRGKK